METLLCVNANVLHCLVRSSTWILSTHFFETWSQGGKIQKRRPCVLVWTANLYIFCIDDVIARPLAFDLWTPRRLITTATTTTTMAGNMLVLVLQKILIRVTRAKYSAALLLRWAEKVYGWLTRHFLLLLVFGLFFYCLFVYSMQALCTCSISSSLFLVNFKRHLQTRMWTTACWVVYNGSIRTQISLKRCRGRWREKKKVILVHVDKD